MSAFEELDQLICELPDVKDPTEVEQDLRDVWSGFTAQDVAMLQNQWPLVGEAWRRKFVQAIRTPPPGIILDFAWALLSLKDPVSIEAGIGLLLAGDVRCSIRHTTAPPPEPVCGIQVIRGDSRTVVEEWTAHVHVPGERLQQLESIWNDHPALHPHIIELTRRAGVASKLRARLGLERW